MAAPNGAAIIMSRRSAYTGLCFNLFRAETSARRADPLRLAQLARIRDPLWARAVTPPSSSMFPAHKVRRSPPSSSLAPRRKLPRSTITTRSWLRSDRSSCKWRPRMGPLLLCLAGALIQACVLICSAPKHRRGALTRCGSHSSRGSEIRYGRGPLHRPQAACSLRTKCAARRRAVRPPREGSCREVRLLQEAGRDLMIHRIKAFKGRLTGRPLFYTAKSLPP